jgi:hypothetical protein
MVFPEGNGFLFFCENLKYFIFIVNIFVQGAFDFLTT